MKGSSDTILSRMFEVGRLMRQYAEKKASCPLPLLHFETLRFVKEHGHPSMREVAAQLRITAPSATSVIDGLATHGFLLRRPDRADRRIVRLSLSKKGEQAFVSALAGRMKALQKLIGKLDRRDQAHLSRLLSKITSPA